MWLLDQLAYERDRYGFQSTHLIRGVTIAAFMNVGFGTYFNPHTSYEVWLTQSQLTCYWRLISIHTPHTRCDYKWVSKVRLVVNFNPHTSYEVWLFLNSALFLATSNFNPHTSYEVWPAYKDYIGQDVYISIHTPHTRCDLKTPTSPARLTNFNPHTSYEVWPCLFDLYSACSCISIHTPHTRCDTLRVL